MTSWDKRGILQGLGVIALLMAPPARSALPPDAQAYLEKLPGRVLSIDLVVAKALAVSDTFRSIFAQKASVEVSRLQARSLLDLNLTAGGSKSVDDRETANAFQPSNTQSTSYNLGVSTLFQTGTSLSAEVVHASTAFDVSTFSIANFETTSNFTLAQSLWKDGLGYATRKNVEAGDHHSAAALHALEESVQNAVLDLLELYYTAWYSQAQVLASAGGLDRRKRLLKITQINARRGTAETPDLLQTQGAVLQSEVQLDEARQSLQEIWNLLVASLKFPKSWYEIDATEIPMQLDTPIDSSQSQCGTRQQIAPPPRETAATKKFHNQAKAAQATLDSAANMAKPDVQLKLSLATNGIDATRGPTFGEAFSTTNPYWAAGLTVTIPLFGYSNEASYRQAFTQQVQADAAYSQALSDLETNWINYCRDLNRLVDRTRKYKDAFEKQSKRALLEEKRFKIGQVPVLNVIQAGDDTTSAELSYRKAQTDARLAAWRVKVLTGELSQYLTSLEGRFKD